MKTIAIVGAGPGLGRSIARRFGTAGHRVAVLGRTPENLDRLTAELRALDITTRGYRADVTRPSALADALHDADSDLGGIDVLVYNPAHAKLPSIPADRITPDDVRSEVEQKVLGAVTAVNTVLPGMLKRGRGSLLFTVGSSALYPVPAISAVGIASAGLRSYALSLHHALAPQGVHVGVAVIDLFISRGDGEADPDHIAERLYEFHRGDSGAEMKIGHLREPRP
ncbi:SDR family NAD(P)-dependent oxidoreductase [Streptomyces sp. HD]|uniref:SDR family NAD(P)-dependent oxidoreductase n=1 Tax=Streptomyces sp. HD TaxID=3020892 RepID=UPI0023313CAA|nr:SDR family NAD(P)-dependent oxidoreductase [Streptomyces sp. HD]MDC0770762.1 SDR family NAD(P)-dependent oxidoreductase [Streptomyces sp. HD]